MNTYRCDMIRTIVHWNVDFSRFRNKTGESNKDESNREKSIWQWSIPKNSSTRGVLGTACLFLPLHLKNKTNKSEITFFFKMYFKFETKKCGRLLVLSFFFIMEMNNCTPLKLIVWPPSPLTFKRFKACFLLAALQWIRHACLPLSKCQNKDLKCIVRLWRLAPCKTRLHWFLNNEDYCRGFYFRRIRKIFLF